MLKPASKTSLIHILNLLLSEGIFPDEVKITDVVCLPNADDPIHFNIYKPILYHVSCKKPLKKQFIHI